jgi:NAD(P)-dependent dehydrogenase (short-subunit alcohol dehydrogenase family)
MVSFASKVCLVTGAGRGLGLAFAQRLHKGGAKVLVCDLEKRDFVEEVNFKFVQCDVTSPKSFRSKTFYIYF